MRKRTECTPDQRAAKYLKRIAALTVAEQVDNGYLLTAGRKQFLVEYNFLPVISRRENRRAFLSRRTRACPRPKSLRLHYCN